ncbi:MAG: ABC transporter substrate-binding protein [Verrucomicrobiales bacterium]|nr:ABC transporter substrate-binding protein [Verrucomicrobiales bacterium]
MRFARGKAEVRGERNAPEIRVGFLPSLPSVALLMAESLGYFERMGLPVRLSCELGSASLRDRLVHGELDGAAADASLIFTTYHGWSGTGLRCPLVTGLMLGTGGSEVVLSRRLVSGEATDAALSGSFRGRSMMIAIGQEYSVGHQTLLRWLAARGLRPGHEVRVPVLPYPQMLEALGAGHIDGFCAPAPWSQQARIAGVGLRASEHEHECEADAEAEAEVANDTPLEAGMALMVTRDFAEARQDDHVRLLSAILQASRFCAEVANRDRVISTILNSGHFAGISVSALAEAMDVQGDGLSLDAARMGCPDRKRAGGVRHRVCAIRGGPATKAGGRDLATRQFRKDLFERAKAGATVLCATVPRAGMETPRHPPRPFPSLAWMTPAAFGVGCASPL